VIVAKSTLKRGGPLAGAEVSTEKRDVISLREPLDATALSDTSLELYEGVSAGQAVLARHVRTRAIVQRGQILDALINDGALSISLKVEALGQGGPGQTIRVRSSKTRREFYAKIKDEQTVLLAL
jgi:flagella basal body P-ring formation protein FlgA